MLDDDGTKLIRCESCYNGRWESECCNGAGGCSCQGRPIDMGPCNVCRGKGWQRPEADTNANIRTIEGLCYLGSGPIR